MEHRETAQKVRRYKNKLALKLLAVLSENLHIPIHYRQAFRWNCILKENSFLSAQPKHMLWELKRTVSIDKIIG